MNSSIEGLLGSRQSIEERKVCLKFAVVGEGQALFDNETIYKQYKSCKVSRHLLADDVDGKHSNNGKIDNVVTTNNFRSLVGHNDE